MIAQRCLPPEFVFQPKDTVNQWIILLGGPQLKPNAGQAVERPESRQGNVPVIIPDEPGVPDRLVRREGGGGQKQANEPGSFGIQNASILAQIARGVSTF